MPKYKNKVQTAPETVITAAEALRDMPQTAPETVIYSNELPEPPSMEETSRDFQGPQRPISLPETVIRARPASRPSPEQVKMAREKLLAKQARPSPDTGLTPAQFQLMQRGQLMQEQLAGTRMADTRAKMSSDQEREDRLMAELRNLYGLGK